MNLPNKALLVAGLLAGAGALTTVEATPIIGGSVVVATANDVVATFQGQTAGYDSELYLFSPVGAFATTRIFHNHINSPGNTVNLGSFAIGTELVFMIRVLSDNNREYYTGAASRNPDNLAHAQVDDSYINPFNTQVETYVGFEDIFGGGDRDYDDLNFSFSNVRATTSVPDAASTLTLLSLGLTGLVGAGRMTRKKD